VSLTLDQADDIVFFGETWDPDDQTQVRTELTALVVATIKLRSGMFEVLEQ